MIYKFLPFFEWFKDYSIGKFRVDLLAGITVALVLIPQSMAYAQLAGLPAYYGLYAAFLPPMIASLFGSSRQLATGPVAVVSLMSAASLEPLATAGSAEFIAYSIALALTVGLFQFLLGVLRLGLVVNFLSHPVVNGFTNAAAIIIATSQFSKFFGVYVDSAPHHYETMIRVTQAAIDYTHFPTLLFGVGAVAIMVTLRKINPRIPNVLIAVAVTTLISYFTGFNKDEYVDVSALQTPGVAEKVKEFNDAFAEVNRLGDERAKIGLQLEDVHAAEQERGGHGGESVESVELRSRIEIISIHLAEAKQHVEDARQELRSMKFTAAVGGGTFVFYNRGAAPVGVETVGKTWRLAVGNKQLDQDSLRMIGGGAIVGKIPEGLPTFTIPELNGKTFFKLLPMAVIISLLGFMEAIAIAKAMAAQTGQKLDPNQELIGQGLANLVGAFSQGYPVSGSFGRSAVNLQAGAQTGLASLFASLTVAVVLLFFTPALYYLPQPVLAAIIMMAVLGLLNPSGLIHTWKAQRHDGIISVITFLATLAFAPHLDRGIILGVTCSILVFLYKSMRPTVATLAVAPDHSLHDVAIHHLAQCRHIAVIRFDGPLFFANASFLEDRIIERRKSLPELRHVIIVADGMSELDATGEETLSLLVDRLRSSGQKISFAGVHYKVRETMERTHLWAKIGAENFYPTAAEAVAAVHADAHRHSTEDVCPLLSYCPVDGAGEAPEVSHVRG